MKVVVIGAGVAGLAIGWRLARAGASVVVLERAQPGRGATWAAAGMIAATAEPEEAGTPQARLAERARALWPKFAYAIEDASGIALGYRRCGALMVAMSPQEAAHQAILAHASAELSMLGPGQARAMEPMLGDRIFGAVWAPEEAQVDNRALGDALALALERAGGTLVSGEAVLRIEIKAGRAVAARTDSQNWQADAFVLAAGAWSGLIDGLPREARPPVRPIKGEMLALAPPAGAALPARVVWGNEIYLVPRGGRLLVGATLADAGFDTTLSGAAKDWLGSHAVGLMPILSRWSVAEHWCGLRPGSPDGLPMLGPSAVEGLFIATGQFRNGILFAPVVAETLTRSVLERADPEKAFDPRRF